MDKALSDEFHFALKITALLIQRSSNFNLGTVYMSLICRDET